MVLAGIYRAFHPQEAQYTFFSNAHGTFSNIDHMIGHKTSLNKFKKIQIISSIFSDHKGLKLETNLKENNPKHSKTWRLNSMLLNNEWVKNEIREEINKFLETNEMNSQQSKTYGTQQSRGSPEREVYSNTGLPKKNRNSSNKQTNLHIQEFKEQQQRQPKQVEGRKQPRSEQNSMT